MHEIEGIGVDHDGCRALRQQSDVSLPGFRVPAQTRADGDTVVSTGNRYVADVVLIGGAMAYTFLRAQGYSMGRSIVEKDRVQLARLLLEKAQTQGVKMVLPIDHIAAGEFSFSADAVTVGTKKFPRAGIGMDIGPATIRLFKYYISKAKTVFWNGPLGVAEFQKFAKGTNEVAMALADAKAFTIVGGGDSAKCIEQLKLQDKINHISTGGGAALQLLESGSLPGLDCIPDKN